MKTKVISNVRIECTVRTCMVEFVRDSANWYRQWRPYYPTNTSMHRLIKVLANPDYFSKLYLP